MKTTTCLILATVCVALTHCKEKPADSAAQSAAGISLDAYFTDTQPPSPLQISIARSNAKPGDKITLTGLVMGREHPFVDGRAAFILGDRTVLTPCNENPGDACETPWDTCCNTPEEKQRATATIQLVGADGRVLKAGLKGIGGLKELSPVTLSGIVDKASTPEALIINATKVHVKTP